MTFTAEAWTDTNITTSRARTRTSGFGRRTTAARRTPRSGSGHFGSDNNFQFSGTFSIGNSSSVKVQKVRLGERDAGRTRAPNSEGTPRYTTPVCATKRCNGARQRPHLDRHAGACDVHGRRLQGHQADARQLQGAGTDVRRQHRRSTDGLRLQDAAVLRRHVASRCRVPGLLLPGRLRLRRADREVRPGRLEQLLLPAGAEHSLHPRRHEGVHDHNDANASTPVVPTTTRRLRADPGRRDRPP